MADVSPVTEVKVTGYNVFLTTAEAKSLARLIHFGVESTTVTKLGIRDLGLKLVLATDVRGEDPELKMFEKWARL